MFSSKSLILSVTAYRHTFQSLFSWMFSSKSEPVALGLLGIKFQSLFSWMFSSKPTAAVRLHVLILCFNPCSLGCFPRRIERISLILSSSSFNPCSLGCFPRRGRSTAHRRYIDRFQSLFSWMFSSKIWNDRSFTPEPESFNPCSLGCFPRSQAGTGCACRGTGFQSLFSWMFSSKYPGPTVQSLNLLFQSLFSWMFSSKFTKRPHISFNTCFNPCSLGCFPRSASNAKPIVR